MATKLLLIDIDQCIRCHACEVACKQENDLDVGPRWLQVITVGPRKLSENLHLDFVPMLCFHCDDAPCAYFCASKAIIKRTDGVVIIDQDKCNQCKICISGCPYGAIHWDDTKKSVGKCNLCLERTDYGLEPSCVQHCIGGAIQFVTEKELADRVRGQHTARMGKVCYASAKWELQAPEIKG